MDSLKPVELVWARSLKSSVEISKSLQMPLAHLAEALELRFKITESSPHTTYVPRINRQNDMATSQNFGYALFHNKQRFRRISLMSWHPFRMEEVVALASFSS